MAIVVPIPDNINSAAVYVGTNYYSLYDNLIVKARYEDHEDFHLCLKQGEVVFVPRGLAMPYINQPGIDSRTRGTHANFENHFKPRHDQWSVVHKSANLLSRDTDHIIEAATGYGKTYVGCAVAAIINRTTLVLTTKEDIIKSWADAAKDVLGVEKVGVWRGDKVPDKEDQFVVGLVQSVCKGYDRYPPEIYERFGLVICDEVHRMGAEKFSQAMWYLPAQHRLGLSATPYRKDGREKVFTSHIGKVMVSATVETLIPKVIVQPTEVRIPKNIHHSKGKIGAVSKFLRTKVHRNEYIVNFISACVHKDRPVIVFSESIEHLRILHDMSVRAGLLEEDMGFYLGLSNYKGGAKAAEAEREAAKYKKVIFATYAMASEATDIPWLDACVLGTPRSDVKQIVGRVRREYEGKTQPVVLDLVDHGSEVLTNYAKNRQRFYHSIGAPIVKKN